MSRRSTAKAGELSAKAGDNISLVRRACLSAISRYALAGGAATRMREAACHDSEAEWHCSQPGFYGACIFCFVMCVQCLQRKRKRSANIPRPDTSRCSSVGRPHFSHAGGAGSTGSSAISPCSSAERRTRSSINAFSPASFASTSVLNSAPDRMTPSGLGRLRISQVHKGGKARATVTTKYSWDRDGAGIVLN
jgi:hypothetical protein